MCPEDILSVTHTDIHFQEYDQIFLALLVLLTVVVDDVLLKNTIQAYESLKLT